MVLGFPKNKTSKKAGTKESEDQSDKVNEGENDEQSEEDEDDEADKERDEDNEDDKSDEEEDEDDHSETVEEGENEISETDNNIDGADQDGSFNDPVDAEDNTIQNDEEDINKDEQPDLNDNNDNANNNKVSTDSKKQDGGFSEEGIEGVITDDMNPPKPPTPQKKKKEEEDKKGKKPPPPASNLLNCFAQKPEEDVIYELRAMSARLLDRVGNKISLDLVLVWPCDVLTVKRKVAAQAKLVNTNFTLVLSAYGRLKDGDMFPEEGLHALPKQDSGELSKLNLLLKQVEEAKLEKERKANPPYFCSAWAVLPGLLPGFKDPLDYDDMDGDGSLGDEDGGSFDQTDEGSMWGDSGSRKSMAMKSHEGGKSKNSKRSKQSNFDNTTSIGVRRKLFSLEYELSTINCVAYTDAVASLGVTEFSSFATLTVKELMVAGLGIPRPAAHRIAQLALVYEKQMQAEDEEREAAALRAKQGRLKKKRQQFDENVAEDMSITEGSHLEIAEVEDRGKFTVDGKFFFTSMKELKQVWGEAALVHKANLDEADSTMVSLVEEHADFSSIDGYHTEDLDSVVAPLPPPAPISMEPTEPDANILEEYMGRLLRPPTPEPPPPIELRSHRARSSMLMEKIRRRTAWDHTYEVPEHMDAQYRPRLACCPKHAIRSRFWRGSKGRDLRRSVANEVDVNLSMATKEGHGYIGDESYYQVAKNVLQFFHVFIEPRDEKEIIQDILLMVNPNGELLGFSQSAFVEGITVLVEKQFELENPVLEYDENAANRMVRQKDIIKQNKLKQLSN